MRLIRSLVRTLVIADKEWIQIKRDTRSLALSIFLPMFLIILFGYALNMDVKRVSTAVFDQDRSWFSRSFLENFSHTEYISIYKYVDDYQEIDSLINSGKISMAIVLPGDFSKRFNSGRPADVQLVVNGSDSTSAMISIGYVKAIIFDFNRRLKLDELRGLGISGIKMPVDIKSRIWYNSELKSKNFIIPGNIVIIMAIISALITSLTISREWERGTMETLITTPVRKHEVFFGKLIPYVLIALFDVVLTVSCGYFVFDVPLEGSFLELLLISLLFLVGTSSLGIMISSAAKSQVLAVQMSMIITYLPSLFLSDYIFPVRNMPIFVQLVTYVVPAKYLIYVMKSIALKGVGFTLLWTQILFLFIYALVVGLISMKKLSLKLAE
ncbi:MAG: ABC transporter permease [Spirochaetes bacterium]|jgi:ABC-2 type transport system permease protein|nr:ABC transporter permease [Spirochaetota bacterium]